MAAFRLKTGRLKLFALAILIVGATSGCARWRLPAIDPSGERIFLPSPNYTTIDNREGYVQGIPSPSPIGRALGIPGPVFPGAATPPDCPEDLVPPNRATADLQTSPDSRGCSTPNAVPRVMVPGCFQRPDGRKFDLINQGVEYEGNVVLKPRRLIAPVGSEVILLGGICDGEGFYKTREPIEWHLQEGSVGTFTEPGAISEGLFGYRRPLGGLFSEMAPQLVTQKYAIGCTSKKVQVLTRGTPVTSDDIFVLNGQGWIGLTSAQEGTSYVTLFGPNLEATTARQANSVVHWIDGQWTLPPPVAAQNDGPQTLTTTVNRRLTGAPIAGWIVRYEIVGGAPALLDGQWTTREVTTDSQGRASIQVTPEGRAQTGSTQVQIQVIRPSSGRGDPDRLIIGQGHSEVAWNAATLQLNVDGPETVEQDAELTYRIDVHNPGSSAVSDVTVRSMIPTGFDYVASTPQGEPFGHCVDWQIGSIPPGETATIDAIYRARQSGNARHCVTARAPSATPIEKCAGTFVEANALVIDMKGWEEDSEFEVDDIVPFEITVTNKGTRRLTDVLLVDDFDDGLRQRQVSGEPREDKIGSIRRVIPVLEPGQSEVFELNFVVVSPGKRCHTLTASAEGVKSVRVENCFFAVMPAVREFRVEISGPSEMTVGEESDVFVDIENTGDQPLSDLQVIIDFPEELDPFNEDPRGEIDRGRVTWFTDETIPPGGRLTTRYQVACEARYAAESVECEAVAMTRDGVQRIDRMRTKILPMDSRTAEPPPRIPDDTNDEDFSRDDRFDDRFDDRISDEDDGAFGGGPDDRDNGFPDSTIADPNDRSPDGESLSLEIQARTDRSSTSSRTDVSLVYLVIVTNIDEVYDRDVQVTVELPPSLELTHYTGPTQADASGDWRTLRMRPIATLRSGESVKYQVTTRVLDPGREIIMRADVTSMRQWQPIRMRHSEIP